MKFGRVSTAAAVGGILSHSIRLPDRKLSKGTVLTAADSHDLEAAGFPEVVIARLEEGEIGEDPAAARIAAVIAGQNVHADRSATGRSNLYAASRGLLVYHPPALTRLNLVDEAMTIAALPPWSVVAPDQLIATVKIIPYGLADALLAQLEAAARDGGSRLAVHPFLTLKTGLLQTRVDGMAEHLLDKTRKVTDKRLALLGNGISLELRCPHHEQDICQAIRTLLDEGCRLLLVAGASATADRRDVVPAGIVQAGGRVLHLGMPVEPGNLLVLAEVAGGVPVVCLPGCARSPALNGFDWVLERLCAGIAVEAADIMHMGAGGLIKGMPSRIQSRRQAGADKEDDDATGA